MVIDTIPDVTVSTIQAFNTNTIVMDSATVASSISNDQEPTDMLHALHHDEKELRILAVVLSLTGGLVLSFLLGVGIFVYWHWRAWRTQRRKKYLKSKKLQASVKTTTIEISLSAHPSMSSPMPSPSSSTSSLSSSSHSEASSLAIEAVDTNRIATRQRDNTSGCSPCSHTLPPIPIVSSSISSTSSSASQRVPPSPIAATTSFISTSPSTTSTPVPSNVSVRSGNSHIDSSRTISNTSDITKRDMMNDSAIYRPSPIITNCRAECSSTSTSSTHHDSTLIIPPLLLGPTSSSSPTPTAPPAKECLDSPSPSTSIPLPPQHMSNEPSFDPPDIPPPAYSPN